MTNCRSKFVLLCVAELAMLLKEKGEDAEASSLLDEAAAMIKTNLKDEKQTNALLSLLCAYAVIDPAKAFVLAERTVDRANSQISLLMLLDRVVVAGDVGGTDVHQRRREVHEAVAAPSKRRRVVYFEPDR